MTRFASGLLAVTTLGGALLFTGCSVMSEGSPEAGITDHSMTASVLGMPVATPESQGFTKAGLDALNAEFHGLVDSQKLAGVTTLLARHGKVVHFDTYGKADLATGADLKPDSIFRIASMTKPTVGVAMMQLWEQGKWKMDDPVSKYIPEFASLQVKKAGGGTEPMKSPMTMAQIMSHSAGFGVSAVYQGAGLNSGDLQGMVDKLAKLPLETQPGTAWDYGPSVDIQGYIVQKLSGQSLDVYMQSHVFGPLGMVDTGFWQPPEKASRVVAINTYSEGKIASSGPNRVTTSKPNFLSGSGGLTSTAKDYWRFAQAMGNGGVLDGKRVLKESTVKLMRTNVLQPGVKVDLYGPNQEGIGFGMDFAIVMDPKGTNTQQGLNSFYWGGAFGTWFWIDPTNDLVFVGMIQNVNGSRPDGGTPQTRPISYRLVYDALKQPGEIGMRAGLVIVLASLANGLAPAQAVSPPPGEAMLKISYGAALGRCDGELVLYPDGRFEASAKFSDKVQRRTGRQDPVYWDLAATGVLEAYGFRRIESVDSYYNTIAPDEHGATEKLAELERKTDYIILDGWTYRIDWRDDDGERRYLMDRSSPVSPMIKHLLREVQFEKRTCGYYFQPMS